ncbi:MAG TPA: hypothetical protein VIW92_16395 [Thermoanaerobaculia bacterium]
MNKLDVYKRILRDTVGDDMPLEDALLHMVVLHTHSIVPRPDVPIDDVLPGRGERRIVLAPLTRTHLAELVASLWGKHDERGRVDFWFSSYGRLTPYELFTDVPSDLWERAIIARDNVAQHDLVAELIEE